MTDFYSDLANLINGNANFASVNHIRLVKLDQDYCEAELTITADSLNFMGKVHGGCLATLADTACGSAVRTRGKGCVTLNCGLNYLAPASGSKIRAVAQVVKAGRTVSVCDVTLLDDQDVKVATGTYTFFLKGEPAV